MPLLAEWSHNWYSQAGEDGMIDFVLSRIGEGERLCVEFGAHDGLTNSNTARLWRDRGWHAVLIEPDNESFELLLEASRGFDCTKWKGFVEARGSHSLEATLQALQEPLALDVLSIDIDGDDLYVLENLGAVRTRVLLCEYNPTIPYWLDLRGSPGARLGASLGAIVRAGTETGYTALGVTETNVLFVDNSLAHHFDDIETGVPAMARTDWYTNVVSDYSGHVSAVGQLPYGIRFGRRLKKLTLLANLAPVAPLIAMPKPMDVVRNRLRGAACRLRRSQ